MKGRQIDTQTGKLNGKLILRHREDTGAIYSIVTNMVKKILPSICSFLLLLQEQF